ncbi:inhibitor of the pro-sigma K processing machinery [Paenibacillus sp. JGP012]|uniref:pro-sigmaK processing inhibitor BofA family protein n=1 Tax=Paenibacillus TaxID=44249 RepID=UPI001622D2A5|nr:MULTISPECIES: pro-sigmaK processing inhibitor BofA family protein [Paenibacillus]MBB6024333.1 inhibitor of the pro-sigma K processing machinery [Paenibacillus sp. JGP012]MBU5356444.1 pro-sigmaK processing inhibitor BofA family protein [Paenibacillus barcinonensis]MDM5280528.1 pro-sigmaK processing inhibitor BofA family protein [Paenibacillus silvae]
MKTVILGSVLVASLLALVVILFRKRLGLSVFTSIGVHLVMAAAGIYVVNYSGWITGMYIPLNPATIGTVTVLGLPGVGLLLGLKISLFA